jgi:predicted nucleic acid-binding protein
VILLDTDVMIDLLRDYPPAPAWLDSVKHERLTLPGYVVMELLEGCPNRRETDQLLKFISAYRICWPTTRDSDRAIADFAVGRLERKLGILDVLIAECAVGLDLPLHSFNVKHFGAIPGLKTIQPYSKGKKL